MVFYLKYRPQQIAHLDLTSVRERLVSIVCSSEIPHAFLFTGPKGTGKTSAARIMAKIINCERDSSRQGSYEPCNICETCRSITNGSNLDVVEIDAASNRGIDEIRSLREKIKLSPVSARAKVYIVDEVHMLTSEAFNALLKTLEEPPKHAYFILATTESDKLPETITSRCFWVEFNQANKEEIKQALRRVVEGEKIAAGEEVLDFIAYQADGSFRDAVKILEEASMAKETGTGGKEVTIEKLKKVTGSAQQAEEEFLACLKDRDVVSGLSLIERLADQGTNFRAFTKGVLDRLHSQLLASYGIAQTGNPLSFSVAELVELMQLFSRKAVEMKTSVIVYLPLELAVVEWVEGKIQDRDSKPAPVSPKKTTEKILNQKVTYHSQNSLLEQLIEAVKPYNHSVAGVLRSCQELTTDGDNIMMSVKYQFHYERLSQPQTLVLLSELASTLLGHKVKVKPVFTKEDRSSN